MLPDTTEGAGVDTAGAVIGLPVTLLLEEGSRVPLGESPGAFGPLALPLTADGIGEVVLPEAVPADDGYEVSLGEDPEATGLFVLPFGSDGAAVVLPDDVVLGTGVPEALGEVLVGSGDSPAVGSDADGLLVPASVRDGADLEPSGVGAAVGFADEF